MSCTLYSGSAPDCGRNAVKGVTYWRRATRRWSGAALVVACLRRRNCQASRREFVGRRGADPPAICGQTPACRIVVRNSPGFGSRSGL